MVATYLIGMPWLTAGMTLVPSRDADVDGALADERHEIRIDLVLEFDLEARVPVVPVLVREVERRELDARDEAEADDELGRAGRGPDGGDGRRFDRWRDRWLR